MTTIPRDEDIREVMARCPGCSKVTASTFLELHENDVEQAVQKYKDVEDILPPDTQPGHNDTSSESSDEVDEAHSGLPKLPTLPVPNDFTNGSPRDPNIFELRELLGAIQAGRADADGVRNHLGYYNKETLDIHLNANVDGFPAIFYVASTNNVGVIREWIKHGADPNVTSHGFPLVAFSILSGAKTMLQAAKTLATLLRFGADPRVLPKAFYDPYCRDLPEGGPVEEELADIDDDNKQWCTAELRGRLANILSLTQRYELYRSSKVKPFSGREKEVLVRQGAEEVTGLHQMIIAQSIATRWLQKKLLAYLTLQKKKPLVFVFAGPSGHGKTELARRFGDLMSLELQVVDCTIFKQDNELFGPRPPYSGHEDGSPLNNFLVRQAGQRCIVFMDEFEKTSKEIHNTLLLPFQDGHYEDRRNGRIVDCSKSIWILATNKLDDTIHAFCSANERVLFQSEDEDAQDKLVTKLCHDLRAEFTEQFGAPLSGRISEILPFLIFSPQESPLIVHKMLMDLETEAVRRVRLTLNREDDVYFGNITMRIKHDATVCTTIARDEYDKKTGARSIAQAVERIVQDPLVIQYLKDGDEFDENQPNTHFDIDVNIDKDVEVRLVPSNEANKVKEEESF